MSIEKPEITKVIKKRKAKEGSAEPDLALEATQTKPGPEATADTLLYREKPVQKQETETVHARLSPKTEKEEFLERLGRYDEDESEEDAMKIRAEISNSGSHPKSNFLEKNMSPTQEENRFLDNLIIKLNEIAPRPIDRKDIDSFLGGEGDVHQKIKDLLQASEAGQITNIEKKNELFELLFDYLEGSYKKEKRKIQYDIAEMDISDDEKQFLASQELKKLDAKYNFSDLKNKYLNFNPTMDSAEKKELSLLLDRRRARTGMSEEDFERLNELEKKSSIIQTWESI